MGDAAWSQPGQVGPAVALTDNEAHIVFSFADDIDLAGGTWTVSAWFKNLQGTNALRTLTKGNNIDDRIIVVPEGTNELGVINGDETFTGSGYNDLNQFPGQWRQVVAVGSGDDTMFYVDGQPVGSAAGGKPAGDVHSIGNRARTILYQERFSEYLDEVRVSHFARSANWLWACWMNQASNDQFAVSAAVEDYGEPVDDDDDGLSDIWEIHHFGGTNEPGAGAYEDWDDDGDLNIYEYIIGTDPTTNDTYRFEVEIVDSNGEIVVQYTTRAVQGSAYMWKDRYYDLEDSTNLVTAPWLPVTDQINILGDDSIVTYTNLSPAPVRFFRVKVRLE